MLSRNLTFDAQAREKLLEGVDAIANAVKVTLGPKGRNVVIESNYGPPHVTKDGVTVAEQVFLNDPVANQGAQILKQAASKTAKVVGDGTTTSTVLAQYLVQAAFRDLAAGSNPVEWKKGMEQGLGDAIRAIEATSVPVTTPQEIEHIATISANGEKEIGKLLAQAIQEVSKEGLVSVEMGHTFATTLEVVKGMEFSHGFVSPGFITNPAKQSCELQDAYILLHDAVIDSARYLEPILNDIILAGGKQVLILAPAIIGDALACLLRNQKEKVLRFGVVSTPGDFKPLLEDIAAVTGGTIISELDGVRLEDATLQMLGRAGSIVVERYSTSIISGHGKPEDIEAYANTIRTRIEESVEGLSREHLKLRLSKLCLGVAIIKAGGFTEVEMKERRDRIEDAIYATRAAIENGISLGGGKALALANWLGEWQGTVINEYEDYSDFAKGYSTLRDSLLSPHDQIIRNAAQFENELVWKNAASPTHGYDAANDQIVDMMKAGIIDPTKVIITALQNAVSVAGQLILAACVSTFDREDTEAMKFKNMLPTIG